VNGRLARVCQYQRPATDSHARSAWRLAQESSLASSRRITGPTCTWPLPPFGLGGQRCDRSSTRAACCSSLAAARRRIASSPRPVTAVAGAIARSSILLIPRHFGLDDEIEFGRVVSLESAQEGLELVAITRRKQCQRSLVRKRLA